MGAYWKAILAALAAGIASLITAVTDNPATDVNESVLTMPELLTAIGAVVVAFGAVGVARNTGFVNLDKAPNARQLAPAAFEAYSQSVGGVSVVGQKIPEWGSPEFKPHVRDAWAASVNAVLLELRR